MANFNCVKTIKEKKYLLDSSFDIPFSTYSDDMKKAMRIISKSDFLQVVLTKQYCDNKILGIFIKKLSVDGQLSKNMAKKALIEWVEILNEVFGLSNKINSNEIINLSQKEYDLNLGFQPYLELSKIYDYNKFLNSCRAGDHDIKKISILLNILMNYLFDDVDNVFLNNYLIQNGYLVDNDEGKDNINRNKKQTLDILEEVISLLKVGQGHTLYAIYLILLAQVKLLKREYKDAIVIYETLLQLDCIINPEDNSLNQIKIAAQMAHNIICIYGLMNDSEGIALTKDKYQELFDGQKKYNRSMIEFCHRKGDTHMDEYHEKEITDLCDRNDFMFFITQVNLEDIYTKSIKYFRYAIDFIYDLKKIYIERLDSGDLNVNDKWSTYMILPGGICDKTTNDSENNIEVKEKKSDSYNSQRPQQYQEDKLSPYEKLYNLIGLDEIKNDVNNLINLVKMQLRRQEQGLKPIPVSLHLVFSGNPGTGKTTIARILAEIYKEIGALSKGQLIEVDRSGLVAGYVGQTALKTQEKIDEALGGILFIDEAYALAKNSNDDYGQEAIDTILKAMEDHRDDFIVIVAGYTEPMKKFINSNPGLRSRFNKYINFPDYSADELVQIFRSMCEEYQYKLTGSAEKIMAKKLHYMEAHKDENFANARDVRNMFEKVITNQASRLAENPSGNIMEIIAKDFD